jgi:Dolichyl-phosphate-mannose-protein mannosyltransferase
VSRRLVDAVALGAMAACVLSLCTSLAGRFLLDIDDCNLALAVEHFDVRMHQPHPPGYLGYVLLLRLVRALSGDAPRWTARLCVVATIVLAWQAARALGGDGARARLAALLTATNPILIYYAVDGQTHAAEAAMAAALVWALAEPRPSLRRALICGLVVAAGGSFRPTYLLLAGPAVAWAYWRHWGKLLAVGALAAAGTLAWLVPTAVLTGGWAAYRAANDALVGALVGKVSLLSPAGDVRYMALNARDTAVWAAVALAPLCLARPREARAFRLCLAMIVPSLIFYFVVLCAEAGYLAGLVAPAAVAGALSLRERRWPAYLVAAAQLAFFLLAPHSLLRTFMQPSLDEILERDVRAGFLFDALHHDLPPAVRVLAVSDFPDLSLMRQFPLLRPATEVLFAHDRRWFPAGGQSWISHATAHAWHAAPGIVLRNDGDDRALHSRGGFDFVVLDPRSSPELRAALQAQTACKVLPESDEEARAAQRWPRSCFGSVLIFYELKFYF